MNIEMKKILGLFCSLVALLSLSGCFSAKSTSMAGRGGEVVGVSGRGFVEPTPYGISDSDEYVVHDVVGIGTEQRPSKAFA